MSYLLAVVSASVIVGRDETKVRITTPGTEINFT